MECKMSLVHALDMAALSARCSAFSMVYNGDILHSLCATACTKSEPQQVRVVLSAGAILSANHTKCEPQ